MTEPQTITSDHLRSLLDADAGMLALLEGRVEVIDASQLDDDEHRGALEVISRVDLVERLGSDPNASDVDQLADALTISVQQMGG